jgi:L-fucose isomerase-like protein
LLACLEKDFELTGTALIAGRTADLEAVFIASGGVEGDFRKLAAGLADPVILLADDKHNSLPAALEIREWLQREKRRGYLLHGDPADVRSELRRLLLFEKARKELRGVLGIIGPPSDWLIGSTVDYQAAGRRWGTGFQEIAIGELIALAREVTDREAAEVAREILLRAEKLLVAEWELVAAARLLPALQKIFQKYGLLGATLRCFDLLPALKTTGCLALALLNDRGMTCGCEGDVASLFSMSLARSLTGKASFMANPSRIDQRSGEIVLAHCTVPTSLASRFALDTHFESGIGVGISGAIPAGPVTIFKLGGADLGEYFLAGGELLESVPEDGFCRTQARIRLSGPEAGYFLWAPLANHHLLLRGDHGQLLGDFMKHCALVDRQASL